MVHPGSFRLLARASALSVTFAFGLVAQAIVRRFSPGLAHRMTVPFHRLICRILGIRRKIVGNVPPSGPVLIVSNHISWLDIVILGSVLPVSFVAKSEVGGWPGAGLLARAQRTIFVDRRSRQATGSVATSIASRLQEGDMIALFAEGTTSDGNRILPYRSSLIGAAGGGETAILPVALIYTARGGLALTRRERPGIAWYGDMALFPHLIALLRAPPLDVTLRLGERLPMGSGADRKQVAILAERFAREALAVERRV